MDEEIIDVVEPTPEEIALNELKGDVLSTDVVNTVKKLMLSLGVVEKEEGELAPFILRDNKGDYFLKVSGYIFPVKDARLKIAIPNENRQTIKDILGDKSYIDIVKRSSESITRVDGIAMPNEPIENV